MNNKSTATALQLFTALILACLVVAFFCIDSKSLNTELTIESMKEKLDLEFANFEEQKDYDSAKARMLSTIEEKATSKEEMNMY